MNKNTLKAIAKRINNRETDFKVGRYTYHANYDRGTVIYYAEYVGGPQIIYFDELPEVI